MQSPYFPATQLPALTAVEPPGSRSNTSSRSDLLIRRALSLTAVVSMTGAALYLVFTDCKSCRLAAQSAGLDGIPLAVIGLMFALLSLSIVVCPPFFNTPACREWLAGSSLLVAAGCAVLTLLQVSLEQYCIPCLVFSAGCAVLATVSLAPALQGKSPGQRGRALALVFCLALGVGAATVLAKTGYGLGSYARYLRARAIFLRRMVRDSSSASHHTAATLIPNREPPLTDWRRSRLLRVRRFHRTDRYSWCIWEIAPPACAASFALPKTRLLSKARRIIGY